MARYPLGSAVLPDAGAFSALVALNVSVWTGGLIDALKEDRQRPIILGPRRVAVPHDLPAGYCFHEWRFFAGPPQKHSVGLGTAIGLEC